MVVTTEPTKVITNLLHSILFVVHIMFTVQFLCGYRFTLGNYIA